jgi:hypothetical protein
MLSIIYIIYLSTTYTITIKSIHRRDTAPLSRMDALEFNDDNNDKGDHVAPSLEFEIDDTDFETTFATPLRGEKHHISCLHEKSHCHISPTTQTLHCTVVDSSASKIQFHTDDSVSVSCSNIIQNLDWIIAYGDVVKNHNTAEKLGAIEKIVQEARIEVMKDNQIY